MQSLYLIRLVPIMDRPHGNQVLLVRIVQADIFHIRRIEPHVRVFQRERHVRVVEYLRRRVRLEGQVFQHVEDLGDAAADGRGAHFPGAD